MAIRPCKKPGFLPPPATPKPGEVRNRISLDKLCHNIKVNAETRFLFCRL
ncbi:MULTISPECIES: hypothetical protein [Planktothricoides]|uniref:Uncharacterized protein n=1 Tax=Planktothricoides raciborskii FACHB-1370 TaxID=2949576 RepID=A0ABR8EEG2_9CYAN|nr:MULTISPECIES: hypothetical protein [Planktothricoides]MBD2544880.1 hypothetical protein [Planktothricoides raciborskii FACHB-1370]MBD2583024.1 hypothetical protein [Planktothricoides raciborskii FACHB-1261]